MHVQDVLMYGHRTVLNELQGLEERDTYKTGACGVWSIKDIIAHLASYERVLVELLQTLTGAAPAETPNLDRYKSSRAFNDEQVAMRAECSFEEVLQEYVQTHDEVRELMADFPTEKLQTTGILAWYGREYDLEDFLVYSFYGHKREHSAQIAAFKDRLAGKT